MLADIRDLIVAQVSPAYKLQFPTIPIAFDNGPFEWNKLPPQYVDFTIEFYDGNQIGMSESPRTRISGYVYVAAFTRHGLGSKKALQVLDWFINRLQYYRNAGLQFQEVKPDGSGNQNGYAVEKIKVPFYSDPA